MALGKRIIETAMENGATLAGIASMEALKVSVSHTTYHKMLDYAGIDTVKGDGQDLPDNQLFTGDEVLPDTPLFIWPDSLKSVLVIGLAHPEDKPALDWWDVLRIICLSLHQMVL